jgi:tRNA (guanine37-N1)-methyltransferase
VRIDVVSLFPEFVSQCAELGVVGRAHERSLIEVHGWNPRDYASGGYRRVDDRPFGGGPGMVIQAEPIIKAITKAKGAKKSVKIVWFSPGGRQFDTVVAQKYASTYAHVILICGRYEGIDARVKKIFDVDEISVGPYVTTGGEVPAMIVVDSVARQIEGVLGNYNSREESRIASHDVYTRPEVVTFKKKKYRVPKVLVSGNHAEIDKHRKKRQSK